LSTSNALNIFKCDSVSFGSNISENLIIEKIVGIANKEVAPKFKIKHFIIGINSIIGKLINFIKVKPHNLLNLLLGNLGKDIFLTLFLNTLFIIVIIYLLNILFFISSRILILFCPLTLPIFHYYF